MKIKKNGKVLNLTESDLKRIVKKVLTEQEIETITNKIKSEGIKNVSNEMITSPQFKGEYSGFQFGGEFNGVNYQWDASGVEGMSGVRGFVDGKILTEKNSYLSQYNIEDADPSGVWVGFYDGKTAFVCYDTQSGEPKCKKIV
tara:strand:- start:39 stop:467 length:429 start_codon:yes stop_codon:yes gene_type:complete